MPLPSDTWGLFKQGASRPLKPPGYLDPTPKIEPMLGV